MKSFLGKILNRNTVKPIRIFIRKGATTEILVGKEGSADLTQATI